MGQHASIPVYFAFRAASALILLKLSTIFLSVADFASFAQFLAFAALLNMAVVGGAQNGLIRQSAAAPDDAALAEVHSAALTIWLAAIALLGFPIALLSGGISHALTGTSGYWGVVIGLAALALAAGPGQILWSLLSGRNRVAQSLGAQTLGLVVATAAAGWFIVHGNFVAAAIGFACGPLIATVAALPFAARLRLRWKSGKTGVRPLLGYSAAMAATLGFSALVLFALRWFYRDRFGGTELGYWLAANRISDMSTQLLGLFMLQLFVPRLTNTSDPAERARLAVRYGLAGAALTGAALAIFLVASRPLVHLFLSDAYLPAIPGIRLYMVGDFFRVWVSVAMFGAFAAGKPGRYAAIEIATIAAMALMTVALAGSGYVRAPQMAYAGAYALSALLLGGRLFLRAASGRWLAGRWRPRAERRTPLQGSAARPH
jgi:O-antigen/teichoic acid export membrane protein